MDVRALSLMRIGLGIVLLTDLIIRSFSIKAFFTDEGVMPLSILKLYNWNPYYFSFHAIRGELWWQACLFILNAICIIYFIAGYRTRLFTFICWAFLVSLQNRNPFILQGGDDLLRMTLLWGIFLPLGEYYTFRQKPAGSVTHVSLAGIGYLLLVASVYFFSALLKTSEEWHSEGTAIYYAFSLDQLRMPLGTFVYQYPGVMNTLTHIVYYIELLSPILLICPFLNFRFRLTGILAIGLLHLGIACTLYVGLFYIIGLVTLIGLLPSPVMDWIDRKLFKKIAPPNNIHINTPKEKHSFLHETLFVLKQNFIVLIICYCLLLNLGNLKSFPYALDTRLLKFGSILRLEQNWGMFSPFVLKDDGFFVYSGYSRTKKHIDIKHQTEPVSFQKPEHVVSEFESDRWRKFSENYVFNNNNYMRPYYCRYLIKKWNKEHPDQSITELTIFFMKEISLPGYQTKPLEKLAVCHCHENEK